MIRRGVVIIIVALCGSVGLSLLARAHDGQSRLMFVYDRGEERSFLTSERTVGEALRAAGIELDQGDVVEPSRDDELAASSYQINIFRVRPVIVIDGTTRLKVLSAEQTPARIARDAGITMRDEDRATLEQSIDIGSYGAGVTLTITRALPVTLELYGTPTVLRTQAATVGELLEEKRLVLGESDRLSHPRHTPITAGMELRLWREGIQTMSVEEEVPAPRRLVYDANRPLGYRAVQTEGQAGVRTLTYQIEIQDGKEIARTLLSAVITQSPRDTVEVIGLFNDGRGLSKAKGAHHFIDSSGISHRETYYDLPMNVVMQACGQGGHYSVRPDGAKIDSDGYIIVAANYGNYPRCSVVETSLGPGKVYDTGGFATRHPHGFDLATDWSNPNGI